MHPRNNKVLHRLCIASKTMLTTYVKGEQPLTVVPQRSNDFVVTKKGVKTKGGGDPFYGDRADIERRKWSA